MKASPKPRCIALALGWLGEPRPERVAVVATVIGLLVAAAIVSAVGSA
ncbi:hypothetical protein [Novosphingobium terrae]|jgi:hypothetical protein|nr:hypothetical protein [Novosphingobium terrae]